MRFQVFYFQLFSALFFFMLFVLGFGSLVALVNAEVTALWDQFPRLKYWQIVLPTSVTFFLCGLIYVTPGGQWLVNLVDYFGATFIIFVLSIAELIGIFWIYGLQNFCDDLEFVLGKRPSAYWEICWGVITPVLLRLVITARSILRGL